MQLNQGITPVEFDGLMQPFLPLRRVALAVSGGPDSMAMAHLMQDWCRRQQHFPPIAFIVDHGLRADSAREAELVRERLGLTGIQAEILRWRHDGVASAVHQEARRARYQLLLEACQRQGCDDLVLAHQKQDQAETILMRLSKGSGIDGLAGMAAETYQDSIRLLRPLLPVEKERLIATCNDARLAFVEDPSNHLPKFARGRLRRVLPLLQDEGLTIDRLIDLGQRAAEARDALNVMLSEFLLRALRTDAYGVCYLDAAALLRAPRAIALRALSHALQRVHAEEYPPTHAALGLVLDDMKDDGDPRTLNGCLVSPRGGELAISREVAAIQDVVRVHAGESILWDGRWRVTLAPDVAGEPFEVRPLGHPPHEWLDRYAPQLRHHMPQGRVRAALPALWKGAEIAIVPFGDPAGRAEAQLVQK